MPDLLTLWVTFGVPGVNDIAPVLGNNNLTVAQGQTVTLSSANLSATDVDLGAADGSLTF